LFEGSWVKGFFYIEVLVKYLMRSHFITVMQQLFDKTSYLNMDYSVSV